MCSSLSAEGYDVYLLVMDSLADEVKNGVKIVSAKYVPKNRFDRLINSRRRLLHKALELNCDLYHLHDPELMPLAVKFKKCGKKTIFDSHEDIPGQLSEKTWIPKCLRKAVAKLYEQYEKWTLKRISGAIGARESDRGRFSKYNKNVAVITNYPIITPMGDNTHKSPRTFSYAGGVSPQWNHDIVLDALSEVDATYDLMGKAEEAYLSMLQDKPAWSKVKYRGKVPFAEASIHILQSVAGLALLQYGANTNWHQGNLANTKLFENMLAAIPVICTDFEIWKAIIDEYKCGICINPRDKEALVQAMNWVLTNPDEATAMGQRGRKAVETVYNWDTQKTKLLELYRIVLAE
jgi:glycosyltransferase involved in cell wall biosynthesis